MTNRRNALVGLLVIALIIAFGIYVVGGISGRVSNDFPVTVTFARVGQLLRVTGDVKARGVIVGKIAQIKHFPNGTAQVVLALDRGQRLPADVSAAIRGKTLFGEKFVELLDPAKPSGAILKPGARIPEDRTVGPFELEEVLQSLIPVLDAAKPGDLGGALHALAQGVAGNEQIARRTIDNALIALRTVSEHRAELDRLLAGVDTGAATLDRVSPDLVAALQALDEISRSLVAHQDDLRAVLRDAPTWLDIVAQLTEARYKDLVDLSVKGVDVLDLVAEHRFRLPPTVSALKTFTQNWVTNLSAPCRNADGQTLGDADFHPSLAGTTCWQVWITSGEKEKSPGGYGPEGPTPDGATAAIAYRAQLTELLALPFGARPTPLQLMLYKSFLTPRGLLPEEML